jgi:hypothetical protein
MDAFDTVDALVAQMHEDVADARSALAEAASTGPSAPQRLGPQAGPLIR